MLIDHPEYGSITLERCFQREYNRALRTAGPGGAPTNWAVMLKKSKPREYQREFEAWKARFGQ